MLHVIGDSHSRIWSGTVFKEWDGKHKFPNIRVHHIGSCLAYNLIDEDKPGKWGEEVIKIVKNNPDITAVALSFGEIDMRTQVIKRAKEQGILTREAVENLAKRMLAFCSLLKEHTSIPIIICGVVASGPEGEDAIGTPFERNVSSVYFDMYLKTHLPYGVYLFSIVHKLLNSRLETKTYLYSDKVHLNLDGLEMLKDEFARFAEENKLINYFQ